MRCYNKVIAMSFIQELFNQSKTAGEVVTALMEKSVSVPRWEDLRKDYEPKEHCIVTDNTDRKDKVLKGEGRVEKASRIYIGLEKLLVNRMAEFMFAIPVQRVYGGLENDTRKAISESIESIYKHARIDTMNLSRARSYFACCEFCTIWYTVEKENTLYGFNSKYKLKCATYSPMDGASIYPLFDEYGDLIALSFKYERKVKDVLVTYFETYTEDRRIKWKMEGAGWEELINEEISIKKIPAIYGYRPNPIYDGLSYIREEIEYTLSRNSDVIAYNSAPIIKVVGSLVGEEEKGASRRIMRVQDGGDVGYISWQQSTEAMRYHVETLTNQFWAQAQMPNVSFDNMVGLGNIGYDARKTLFMDAELKVGDERGAWIEILEREFNVIKAFLAEMNTAWAREIEGVTAEHIITAYKQDDEKAKVEMYVTANGGKPVISQEDSIRLAGLSENPDATIEALNKESEAAAMARMGSVFQPFE